MSGVMEISLYASLGAVLGQRNRLKYLLAVAAQAQILIGHQTVLDGYFEHIALAGCKQVGIVVIQALIRLASVDLAVADAAAPGLHTGYPRRASGQQKHSGNTDGYGR